MTIAKLPEAGLVHVMPSWPQNAPSTITSCGFLDGSRSTRYLNALVMLCVTLSPLAHSCVVFDTPSESRTIFPLFVSVLPDALSGTISFVAIRKPADSCAGGRVFAPFG